MRYLTLTIVTLLMLVSCQEKKEAHAVATREYVKEENIVKVVPVRHGIFYKEILNNGKLNAVRKAELTYKQSGEVSSVNIVNGQQVKQEQLLSQVENTTQKHELEKAQLNLDKARLDMEDFLIGAGYVSSDTANIPKNILDIANIRSGYKTAEINLLNAEKNYLETSIIAPFSGLVSNVEAKPFNPSSKYKVFCELIDNRAFDVCFSILETEYKQIKKGLPIDITVSAFPQDTFPGLITSVNPSVDDNGMIKVQARIPNKQGKLVEGMNARIIVKIAIPNQLIVPKSAVVLRQERKVVFVNKNDSTAHWHYVWVKNENSHEVSIKAPKIKVGDEVIVEGNLELGHLSPIVVR